jgi:ABC-2 type transport system permease protein
MTNQAVVDQSSELRPATATRDMQVAGWGLAFGAAFSLAWREILRFLRQPNRIVGAIGQPVLFWLLFGTGMNQTFQIPGQRFSDYYIPGTLVLILLFTAIFATISVIEDRQQGFLQAVLVAPVPRWSVVLGKACGGSLLALGQALLFLILTLSLGMRMSWSAAAAAIAMMSLIAIGLTCLGFCLAWRLDSTQGFHAIMSLLLMPMWLLSGAFFPVPQLSSEASWGETLLHGLMRLNPVTYAVAGLRQILHSVPPTGSAHSSALWLPRMSTCWWVTGVFALLMFLLAARVSQRPAQGDLR